MSLPVSTNTDPQYIVSLPPCAAENFTALTGLESPDWCGVNDPPDRKLGSGGGTASALLSAWQQTAPSTPFGDWLKNRRKIVVHGGGRSRRLPAYAPLGKVLSPLPVCRWSVGQRLDQRLLDLQTRFFEQVTARAQPRHAMMVCSGDVLLLADEGLPGMPDADVVFLGLWMDAAEASRFGVFFCPRGTPQELAFTLQKPHPRKTHELAKDYLFMVDIGVWLFSERATNLLMQKTNAGAASLNDVASQTTPSFYDLYADFGPALGTNPAQPDADLAGLTAAAVPLNNAAFYHFGTSNDLINATCRLQNRVLDQQRIGASHVRPHPDVFQQNAVVETELTEESREMWIENACIPATWSLNRRHVLTGIPSNTWNLRVPLGICIDVVPVGERQYCLRPYHIDDAFRGKIGDEETFWQAEPVSRWFESRGLSFSEAGVDAACDIQEAPLFPLLYPEDLTEGLVSWMIDPQMTDRTISRDTWLNSTRLSADEIANRLNPVRLRDQRRQNREAALPQIAANHRHSIFYKLDLEHVADLYVRGGLELPETLDTGEDVVKRIRDSMFRSHVFAGRGLGREAQQHERQALDLLRESIFDQLRGYEPHPQCSVQEDQIVWGRSPVRLDLAGGWTDTPPHTILYGGRVVNVAVDLNGQPPVQVYVRRREKPDIVIRSIDLGVEERIDSYEKLEDFGEVGSGFGIAKAALVLAGFSPRCREMSAQDDSLRQQLERFGGGLELSMLAAVPKGSGLGTSSILAATLLNTLSDVCGLGWDADTVMFRTLVLEQLLTTGGGWQDQAGSLFPGVKMIETEAGFRQEPAVKWLPEKLFDDAETRNCMLLYYTGVTRTAKDILGQIVRRMFLNHRDVLRTLDDLSVHALDTYQVIQKARWDDFCRAIARSWQLNREIDSGTNPPQIHDILERTADYLAGAKLLGAGGGGYMFMAAKDPEAVRRIKEILADNPPNPKARFVDFDISDTGIEVTRS